MRKTMSFIIESHDGSVVVHIGKTLDFDNAEDFKQVCREKVIEGIHYFVLDFSKTGILDSTGLGAIFFLYKQIVSLNGEVAFADISTPVRMVMQISRMHKVFPCYDTIEEACAAQRLLYAPSVLATWTSDDNEYQSA
ncbi:MAG: STAS domain-containing protein [Rhodothermales bacterium]